MKRNLLTLIVLCITFYSLAQVQVTPGTEPFYLDRDVCTYYANPTPKKVSVLRSNALQERMANDTPCSTINVIYNGFTAEAQAAFEFAVSIWEHSLESSVPITVNANFSSLPPGVLGGAGPNGLFPLTGDEIPENTLYPAALAEKITGSEIGGDNSVDINATFSNIANFYFGLDGNPPINQIDFVSVVLHELGHGLGISGFGTVNNNNEGAIRNSGGFVSIWDQFIENNFGISILAYPDPSILLRNQLTSNNLFCNSAEATAQNNNIQPKTYAPTVFQQGSSYSHWDETTYPAGHPNSLMTPSIASGEAMHDPGLVTLGFMQDMGWTICGSLLSVNELTVNDLEVFPNPFTSSIKIKLQNGSYSNFDVSIVDINGKAVYNNSYNVQNGEININDLKNLGNAMYFLIIKDNETGASLTKKIVKQ
ncbi:T9SS type A sorting domain-containing protein [Winogradskyella sp. 3972H.M.0a.05]|uniref:T9SS type A sorting domain-containing protein n=1 Tax=Winogradskyella sp. 3972H.M.0a.05 TaxID=2950277 RepID=UPI003392D059